ncbi:hypothetical protein BCR34DRAFT_554323 [Clohesyomyces aquaticus]|uniref:NmrA-like domain-containing protein n=1 Tax=Clohesyomyces aquaticus TaxID=1231657 RepID=A0A1Y2A6K3_9PLEO|nr:hypothetical protein BCR34DRAFT_554323 [Clohesyomyces aquaticus]
MAEFRSVAVFGASGNSGDAIVPALLAAGLKVYVVKRTGSNSTFPPGAHVLSADYTSLSSLTYILQNIDAVVSLVGPQGFPHQTRMIDAAVAAGVKYFIPSEFGHDYTIPEVFPLVPVFSVKNTALEHLKIKQKEGLDWTVIITGLWFDWGLPLNMFDIDLKAHKAVIWDGGNATFRSINMQDIARAVTTLLVNPSARAGATNKHIHISSLETTQNEVLAAVEEVTGTKFEVENLDSDVFYREAEKKIAGGDQTAVVSLLTGIAVSKREYCAFGKKADAGNKLLLSNAPKESVKETVERVLSGGGPQAKWQRH